MMNTLWGRPPAGGRNYVVQLFAWAFAWAPGLVALTIGRAPAATMSISGAELLERIDRGEALHILDVRSEGEFGAGHVPGAVNIPVHEGPDLNATLCPWAAGDELMLYCGHGPRAHTSRPPPSAAAAGRGSCT